MKRLGLIGSLAILVSCGSSEWPDPAHSPEVVVRVEVVDTDAHMVGIRVWDEELRLLRDDLVSPDEFPRHLRFFPRDDAPRAPRYRHVWVELELWSEEGCPRGRTSAVYRYGQSGQARHTLIVERDEALGACAALYVDRNVESSGPCLMAAPCDSPGQALYMASQNSLPTIVHVAGDATYNTLRPSQAVSEFTPLTVRAWPGRSLSPPLFRGRIDGEEAGIYATVLADFELDGVDVEGGAERGIVIHRTRNGRVRHCRVRGHGDRGGITVDNSEGVLIEHNLVEGGQGTGLLAASDGAGPDGTTDISPQVRFAGNLVRNNQGDGFVAERLSETLEVVGNTLCANRGAGVRIPPTFETRPALRFSSNLIVGHRVGFQSGEYPARIVFHANTFDENEDGSIAGDNDAIAEFSENVLFGESAAPFADANAVDDPSSVDRDGCFAVPRAAGVCATFPDCD